MQAMTDSEFAAYAASRDHEARWEEDQRENACCALAYGFTVEGGELEGRVLSPQGRVTAVYVSQKRDGQRRWWVYGYEPAVGSTRAIDRGPFASRAGAVQAALGHSAWLAHDCGEHGLTTVVSHQDGHGFTGAPISSTTLACGCVALDDEQDTLDWVK
jgi:hypothetical protein